MNHFWKSERLDIVSELFLKEDKDNAWIYTEDFEPLKEDKFSLKKYKEALKKNYSALCDDCYIDECCEEL